MARLASKVAVVTGGARGLGRATALQLAREGADVVVMDVDLAGAAKFGEILEADSVAGEIEALGRRALGFEIDLTDKTAVEAAFAQVAAELAPIDVLVNVAGGALTPMDTSTPSLMSLADIRTNFDVNYLTAVLCAQAVIPSMIERKAGVIVNTTSASAVLTAPGGRLSPYGAAKAAVSHLTRDLAAELGPHGIRVNCVSPGLMATARVKAQARERKLAEEGDAQAIPLRRLGEPDDIATTVAFLVSDDARYITGQVLSVCGGLTLVAN